MFIQILYLHCRPSVTSVQHLPQILPRALHVLSLTAVSTMPMQPWSASPVRIRSASSISRTRLLEWLLASATALASLRHKELHWLPVKWLIDFKVTITTYNLLESNEPAYLQSRILLEFRGALWDHQLMTDVSTIILLQLTLALGHFAALPRPSAAWHSRLAISFGVQEQTESTLFSTCF